MIPVLVNKEKNEATFTMAFNAEDFDAAIEQAYKAQRGKFVVDGFRKGKAPKKIIEAKFGEDVFFEDALDELFRKGYPQALETLKINPVDRPSIDFGEEKIEKGKDFVVTVKVTAAPEVKVKNYKGVKVKKVEHKVKAEDVKKELEALQKRNARLVVADRKAKEGDTVHLDYSGFVGDHQFEGGTAENQTLLLGSKSFIPGFEEQLVGACAGEEREVTVTFPADYHAEDLAGKEAIFKCKIHDIKEEELPSLDDEFAKDVSEFDTLKEFKDDIKAKLVKHAEEASEYETKNAVMERVYEENKFEIPQIMIDDQVDQMLEEFSQQLSHQGLSLDLYCQYLQKTKEDIRKELAPEAEKKVKSRIIIEAVADAEGIEASKEDIDDEMKAMAEQYNMEVDKLKELFNVENSTYLIQDIRMRKAIEFMYGQAVMEDFEKASENEEE
jgi:trigger factor